MNMKLLCVVVSYFPDKELLLRNISQYIDYVDKLIIWENTPKSYRNSFRIGDFNGKVLYNGTDDNEFIAYPLNQCIKYGINNDFTHILTMDQDSVFDAKNGVIHLINAIKSSQQLAIYAPQILPSFCKYNDDKIIKVDNLITSGMILDLRIPNIIGYFREDYKIDYVDFEYCTRAKLFNIPCYIVPQAILHQNYGNLSKNIFGYSLNYSETRLYFQTRNRIYLQKDYSTNIKSKKHSINILIFNIKINLKLMLKIFLFEKKKFRKISAIVKGFIDGIKYKSTKKYETT